MIKKLGYRVIENSGVSGVPIPELYDKVFRIRNLINNFLTIKKYDI
ncbi:Uncharacterized protein dnm_054230 [Desulfonema magnum]|uniref:Uncharacterized protein n=1 Tax=Desulfonema magnum TaxID=45655 RepID=A0A975BQ26_9BACT|nr:Uncharacterized protein dnm_054230 [Desulfonema magnum]